MGLEGVLRSDQLTDNSLAEMEGCGRVLLGRPRVRSNLRQLPFEPGDGRRHRGLTSTANLWPSVVIAFGWVRDAAQILGQTELSGGEVRRRMVGLLGAMTRHRESADRLSGAIDHFVKVSRSYWIGLFSCYGVAELPRTNNVLEQAFGKHRYPSVGRRGGRARRRCWCSGGSRARRELYRFMHGQCGLVNADNPCRCPKKTKGFIDRGHVDPDRLLFVPLHVRRVREAAAGTVREIEDVLDREYATVFRSHPFLEPADQIDWLRRVFDRPDVRMALHLD